jgi:hypothetical protein
MTASKHSDGQYALHCWLSATDEVDFDSAEYCETVEPLRARAAIILPTGHYEYVELNRWNAATGEWDNIEVFESD